MYNTVQYTILYVTTLSKLCTFILIRGKTISIYNIPKLFGIAHELSFLPRNINKGFEKIGILSYNPLLFTDEDLLCPVVTDRPYTENSGSTDNQSEEQAEEQVKTAKENKCNCN